MKFFFSTKSNLSLIILTTYTPIAGAAVNPGESIPITLIKFLASSTSSIMKSPPLVLGLIPENVFKILATGNSSRDFCSYLKFHLYPL